MRFELLGFPDDSPVVELSHDEFAYAGKFATERTGKAVAVGEGSDVIAALSFDTDRAVEEAARIRYIEVRNGSRGEGIAPELADFVSRHLLNREYELIRIGVNNPFAYHAMYKAGFEYTGEKTGLRQLVLERPARSPVEYSGGMEYFEGRDELNEEETSFVQRRMDAGPPRSIAKRTL